MLRGAGRLSDQPACDACPLDCCRVGLGRESTKPVSDIPRCSRTCAPETGSWSGRGLGRKAPAAHAGGPPRRWRAGPGMLLSNKNVASGCGFSCVQAAPGGRGRLAARWICSLRGSLVCWVALHAGRRAAGAACPRVGTLPPAEPAGGDRSQHWSALLGASTTRPMAAEARRPSGEGSSPEPPPASAIIVGAGARGKVIPLSCAQTSDPARAQRTTHRTPSLFLRDGIRPCQFEPRPRARAAPRVTPSRPLRPPSHEAPTRRLTPSMAWSTPTGCASWVWPSPAPITATSCSSGERLRRPWPRGRRRDCDSESAHSGLAKERRRVSVCSVRSARRFDLPP